MIRQSEDAQVAIDSTTHEQAAQLGALRGELAQLHGSANKLLATRIDAILTSELISGRDDARAKRKALIKQVEKLIEKCESQIKRYDKLRAQQPTLAAVQQQ